MRPLLVPAKGAYLDLIASGRKTTTIRTRCTAQLEQLIVFTNYRTSVRTTCTKIERRRLRDLTDADARADGFDDLRSLVAALISHYPTLAPGSRLWVVTFALQSGSNAASCS